MLGVSSLHLPHISTPLYASTMAAQPVKLYVYDLSRGMARTMSQAITGTQIDGIW